MMTATNVIDETVKVKFPIATMVGSSWNILDANGMRIAICGDDDMIAGRGGNFWPQVARDIVRRIETIERQLAEAMRLVELGLFHVEAWGHGGDAKRHLEDCSGCDLVRTLSDGLAKLRESVGGKG